MRRTAPSELWTRRTLRGAGWSDALRVGHGPLSLRADFVADQVRDAIGMCADFRGVAPFDKKTDFWLGTAVAQQHAPGTGELLFGGGDKSGDVGHFLDRALFPDLEI